MGRIAGVMDSQEAYGQVAWRGGGTLTCGV
jgi:hypothetical protein